MTPTHHKEVVMPLKMMLLRGTEIVPMPWCFFLHSHLIEKLQEQGYEHPMSEYEMEFKEDVEWEDQEYNVYHVKKGDVLRHWA